MVDISSGNRGVNNSPVNSPNDNNRVRTDKAGRKGNQTITSNEPDSAQVDRTPSQTPASSLNKRNIKSHQQTHSLQGSVDISTIRRLALSNQWPGVLSAIKLHISDQDQLSQLLHELGSAFPYPADVQDAICDEFSTHCASRTAAILVSNLSDDPNEARGSLLLIIDQPERHDSPIGFLSRRSSKEFVAEHDFDEADVPLLVFKTTERTYDQVVSRIEELENQLLEYATDEEAQAIRNNRNERRIETEYRREQITVR